MSINNAEYPPIVQRTLRQAERIALEIGKGVVPVWCDSSGMRTLIGTGFFAERDGHSFLVTANHNFSVRPEAALKIEFSGEIWTLGDMSAWTSTEDDLWVAETCGDLHNLLQSIKVPLLARNNPESCRFSTGSVLLGYPADLNIQGELSNPLAISTALETRDLMTGSKLPEPLIFDVQGDVLTTACGEAVMERPEIFGMSGGPVFGWYCTQNADGNTWVLEYFLQGVILAWQRRDGYVVACNTARIAALLGFGSAS